MEIGQCNLNFIYASEDKKNELGKLLEQYTYFPEEMSAKELEEAERILMRYGLL
jgi:hypothetical protein